MENDIRVVADVRRFMHLSLRLDPTVLERLKARAAAKGQPCQSLINDIFTVRSLSSS